MKTLLVLLVVLWSSACTSIIRPSQQFSIPLTEIPELGAGQIQPVAMDGGRIKAERVGFKSSSSIGTTGWAIDVGEWSLYFANRLREEYSRRGVDVEAGPKIMVEVIDYKITRERVSLTRSRIQTRIIADIHVGDQTWTFNANTDIPNKTSAAYDLTRLILNNREIQAIILDLE